MPNKIDCKGIIICTIVGVRYIDDLTRQILIELNKCVHLTHLNLSLENWYGEYKNHGRNYTNIKISRPYSSGKSWWCEPKIQNEFLSSVNAIKTQIDEIIESFNPNMLLIMDDSGQIEQLIMSRFRLKEIPIILFIHGFTPTSILAQLPNKCAALVNLKRFVRQGLKIGSLLRIELSKYLTTNYLVNSKIDPDLTLYPSEYEKNVHAERSAISTKHIVTGLPYFDNIQKNKKRSLEFNSTKINVLIVSAGLCKFSFTEDCTSFIDAIVEIRSFCSAAIKIDIRPKNGEEDMLYELLIKKNIERLGIRLTDNSISFHKAAINYDLVISDASSLAAFECYLLGVPVLLLDFRKSSIYATNLDFPTIYINNTLECQMIATINNWSNLYSSSSFDENALFFFGPIDGQSGSRAANAILDAISCFH